MKSNPTVIVGLGKTGLSCVRYLRNQGYEIAVTDSRNDPPGLLELQREFPDVVVSLGKFDANLLARAQTLVVSPGVALHEPMIAAQIARGTPAIGDIELFARHIKAPVIAVTGTNGKSTVTTLVGVMGQAAGLDVRVGGNLGTPALELIQSKEPDLYALELSSFQLETTYSLHTVSAAVLNITPDHMDRYANFEEYIAAKQRIYHHCQFPVFNRDDPLSHSGLKQLDNAISFGLNEPKTREFGLRQSHQKINLAYGQQNLMSIDELQIKGRHQWANALAALALGYAAELSMPAMLTALKTFQGLAHRCQWVANKNNVDWYNDSKGTNVNSSLAAIEGLGTTMTGKLILIAGGQGKQQDFSPLRIPVSQYVRTVILIGQDAALIAKALDGAMPILFAKDLEQAINLAKQASKPGDAVLLSPACASFDMFRNFEHRGEVFMELVRGL